MSDLAQLANRFHRGKDVAKVMIDIALPELCRVVVEHPEMSAAQRVDHALDSHMSACRVWLSDIGRRMTESDFMLQKKGIDRAGKRFWGSYLTFSRRRTVKDCLIITYHDAAEQLLAS